MKHHVLAYSSLALLASLAAGCAEELPPPPPMTAENPPPPPPGDAPVAAPAPTDGTQYASGEVAVGDDPPADGYDDNDPSALQDFHPALDPAGTWQDDPTYGTVWTPSAQVVGADFAPYQTAGHWAYDNDEYVWVSDYDWGWAPFHYGRWVVLAGGGWGWIPGREYRGAWVGWGADPGYATVGWYPMGPEFIWRGGVAVGFTYAVGPRWAYCGRGDVFAPNLGARVVVGPAGAAFAGRVQPFAASGGARFAGGPAPSKLGLSASQVPHATGNAGLAKATGFAKPSTAVAMGGHVATRTPSTAGGTSATNATHGSFPTTGAASGEHGATTANATHGSMPTTGQGTASTGHATTGAATPMTGSRPSATGAATTGAANHAQPQPKKKPVPQDNPAPKKAVPGRSGGGHHR